MMRLTIHCQISLLIFLLTTLAQSQVDWLHSELPELRNAALQGDAAAQFELGWRLQQGDEGVSEDPFEAISWYRKSAEQGHAGGQCWLAVMYENGLGTEINYREAVIWYTKAAYQHGEDARFAQNQLGCCYLLGRGVAKNEAKGVMWLRKAAEEGLALAQKNLGNCYDNGDGVVENPAESHKWMLLAAANGDKEARGISERQEERFSNAELIEGRRRAQNWESTKLRRDDNPTDEGRPKAALTGDEPKATGTGFLITRNGYLVTNLHVVKDCSKVRVQTSAGLLDAVVVRVDDASDLALLKIAGTFEALPVVSSRSTRLGATVATVGFPNVGLQGFEPKLSKGDISSLAGIQDDVRYFQISVPVQPGNSGGALVDERGNVVGVVTAQLNQEAALQSTGTLAQNVNYAVKSSYLLSFLEAVPEASAEIPDAKTHEQKFEAVVDDVMKSTVLIIGY
jgi:TPR repeat protein